MAKQIAKSWRPSRSTAHATWRPVKKSFDRTICDSLTLRKVREGWGAHPYPCCQYPQGQSLDHPPPWATKQWQDDKRIASHRVRSDRSADTPVPGDSASHAWQCTTLMAHALGDPAPSRASALLARTAAAEYATPRTNGTVNMRKSQQSGPPRSTAQLYPETRPTA